MYPHGMPNIPNGRETSPRIPFPPGRADGFADCLSLHTLVHGRLTVAHWTVVLARRARSGGHHRCSGVRVAL